MGIFLESCGLACGNTLYGPLVCIEIREESIFMDYDLNVVIVATNC